MDETTNLLLPYILAAQAQKHVTHNEALRKLDAIVQLSVADRDLSSPPASPADGARYIVAASPAGEWSGQAGKIAAWQDAAWAFYAPREGWLTWIEDENTAVIWDGAAWASFGGGGGGGVSLNPATGALVGINATADSTNRLSLSSPAILLNHEGAGHQLKINKAAAADTASLLFQTAFSGRAEMGTAGDDDFHFKVSADGTAWHEAILIDKGTGAVAFPNTTIGGGVAPTRQIFTASGTWTKPTGCRLIKVTCIGGGGSGTGCTSTASNIAFGGSGAGGGSSIKWIDATALTSETVTVGAGATGGSGTGSAGGSSSFGVHCSATGGSGGVAATSAGTSVALAAGSDGGAGSGGDLNVNGGAGGFGIRVSGTSGRTGLGGGTVIGSGGAPGIPGNNGNNGGLYGGGGSGAAANSTTSRDGGSGADGVVIVEEFY